MQQEPQKSVWLQIAQAMIEELEKEPPEVQQSIRRMNRKTYPESWRGIREREAPGEESQQ